MSRYGAHFGRHLSPHRACQSLLSIWWNELYGSRPVIHVTPGTVANESPDLIAPAIATFFSYSELLPRTAAMVTNGGYGGVQNALSYGLPLVVAGTTEDKLEVSARVVWSGTGINLKTDTPTPTQVYEAVQTVLDDPRYRRHAQTLQAEYACFDAVSNGVTLIERLAITGQPVLRSASNMPASKAGLGFTALREKLSKK